MAGDAAIHDTEPDRRTNIPRSLLAALLLLASFAWMLFAVPETRTAAPALTPQTAHALTPSVVASMNSPVLSYSDGWRITEVGADPSEPPDPWTQPSGVLMFAYTGAELALNLAVGDYWAYLYVTVDGQPANRLPSIRNNTDSTGAPAGYRTFYSPEQAVDGAPASHWVRVHHALDPTATHHVRVEVWRGWGQTPLRGIAVDALPPTPPPIWPGVVLLLGGLALLLPAAQRTLSIVNDSATSARLRELLAFLLLPKLSPRNRLLLAAVSFFLAAAGVWTAVWWLSVTGLVVLAVLSLARPALWTAVLTFSLPFYFAYAVPILPNHQLGLIDTLVLLGFGVACAHQLLTGAPKAKAKSNHAQVATVAGILLAFIIGWALASTSAAERLDVALREWRTVFLYAGLFALLLSTSLRSPSTGRGDLWLIVGAWVAGGVAVSFVGLAHYASGNMLISAEGVRRIRALYGSPNNLALYLERTFMVTLALAAFLPNGRTRVLFAVAASIQAIALALTFSKGALLLGVPAGLLILWAGGLIILPRQDRSRRPLLWLAAFAIAIVLVLAPFLGTDRFRGLFDLSQGTARLRLLLWRSSWQMALDHPLFGVGPDNFLYAYRSIYILPEAWQEPNLNHPHNWILDWWTRIGLPGLAAAAALFVVGLGARWRMTLRNATTQPRDAILALGFLAAGGAALAHGLIDASYALPDLMIVWVLILLAATEMPEHNSVRPGNN